MRSLLIITLGVLFFSCGGAKVRTEEKKETSLKPTPVFNTDSAFTWIEKQVAFGPRVPNTPEHESCKEYLVGFFEQYGIAVVTQEFQSQAYDGTILNGTNIIASIFPEQKKRIVLAAHWDTRPIADQDSENKDQPILGANDGGSGVAVLMEIARVLQVENLKPDVGVDIILFDLEDYGAPADFPRTSNEITYCLGSQYWKTNKHKDGYFAYYGILLDMVAGEGSYFVKEGASMQYAPKVMRKVWKIAHKKGYGNFFVKNNESPFITDDHLFMNEGGIPTIDIIGYNPKPNKTFPDSWHTHNDNLDHIDKSMLTAVGNTVLQVLFEE